MCQKLIFFHYNWLRTEDWASRLGCLFYSCLPPDGYYALDNFIGQ